MVEAVTGQPIDEFQDPDRPLSDYARKHLRYPRAPVAIDTAPSAEIAPEERIHPPLVGAAGRNYHEVATHHHAPTLAAAGGSDGSRPGRSPERLYLHYLLLHLDRLDSASLAYLYHAVREETKHRRFSGPSEQIPADSFP